ncbi:hypothetical protein LJ725_19870 [Reyranella aquatilis]|uniref:Uncharacterized protein n=2 Tax=Reyranella aquatilis TaxID=2035356 RepID=A0ABS8L043_9HYPH|nr:hypothetical protein [Reyranella aquatilis]
MRENVYLGDVYLFMENPCRGSNIARMPQSILLGALPERDIQLAFEQFYGSRPHYPRSAATSGSSTPSPAKTASGESKVSVSISGPGSVTATSGATPSSSTSSSSASGDKGRDSPSSDEKNPIFTPGTPRFTRLPMASLPDIKLYDYVGGTAGGLFGPLSLAFAGDKSRVVKVSAQQVEMTELPAGVFLAMVDRYKASDTYQEILRNLPRLAYNLELELRSEPNCRPRDERPQAFITFVNSVYYTRNLSFEFGEDSSFAAKLAATLPATLASTPATSPFSPPNLPASAASTNPAQVSSQGLLSSLGTMSGGPGGGFSFGIGTSGNLALNQTFARPMAFATHHSIFEPVSTSGSQVVSQPTVPDSPIPTIAPPEQPAIQRPPERLNPPSSPGTVVTPKPTPVPYPDRSNPLSVDIPKM